ncbi:hypothetical protein EV182_004786 [Spiromyces aspiralis]|uniref:Uncharacterized protein n=1 Tax=Spiromyces aspiralis TaxID=68401 RepID=A0ACC1HP84_9FUNG|nr:hypothetical protein EV182_004786 [Spiromyces aspiralis]
MTTKYPASHATSDERSSDEHPNDKRPSDECSNDEHPNNERSNDEHPSGKHLTSNPTCEDVVKALPLTDATGSTINNELQIEQVALASIEDEHLGATMVDQMAATDASQGDYYLLATHYLLDDLHYPESTLIRCQNMHNAPIKPRDTVLSGSHHMPARRGSKPTPIQTELYKIAEQVANDPYSLAEFDKATSDDAMSGNSFKWFFMEDPEEPISKDPSFGLAPPGCCNYSRHSNNEAGQATREIAL